NPGCKAPCSARGLLLRLRGAPGPVLSVLRPGPAELQTAGDQFPQSGLLLTPFVLREHLPSGVHRRLAFSTSRSCKPLLCPIWSARCFCSPSLLLPSPLVFGEERLARRTSHSSGRND